MTLTSLKGEKTELNPSKIMEVKRVPDTVIVFMNGSCMMVRESVEDVVARFEKEPLKADFRLAGAAFA